MAGGTSFYMAHGISRLPRKVDFQLVTKVGREEMLQVNNLRQICSDVVCYPSAQSVYFENKYHADGNHRTQRVLAKADPFTIEEMRPLQAKVFHLGSLLSDDFSPDVVQHLATKGRVSIDAQGYLREVVGQEVRAAEWKDKEKILSCTDVLKLNEREMEVVTHSRDPHAVAKSLAGYGVKEVIVTLDRFGSIIYAEGKFYDIPAYKPKELVDATGCGDTYSTGYLYCRLQGMGYEESGKFAAAMCTLKLERSGPFDGTIDDIYEVIENRARDCAL
jgi:hypothetical protein